jgi:sugar O-acyltransferase (sialic acid O-acetyltransferase NeuD family)
VATKLNKTSIILLGAGGHSSSVASVAISAGFRIRAFVDPLRQIENHLGFPFFNSITQIDHFDSYSFAMAVGDNSKRQEIYEGAVEEFGSLHFPILAHQSSVISSFSKVAEGTVIMPHSIVGANSVVGKFCILNTRSSLDHDCLMQDFSSLAPGAITSGLVTIGTRSAVSLGAVIKQRVTIGNDTVIGANSYVNQDIENNCIAYGTPAKKIRFRNSKDTYLD